jgi:glycosyltransferase involved in cell wall biosynthesis
MIEAMSCGCVAIRTPGGGWQEQIVEGVNGFIIPFNNAQALADCIADLSDPKLRAIMRVNAMNYAAENFSQEQMISKTSALHREVANYAKRGWQGGRARKNDSGPQGHSS